ncbi:uncharacterized protein LOC113307688 [Papaver somniferum]|uniref:uncharacterized protein LOC113307688 n=1 Tax=Papaver somniferum TaxID=3469 RepID=UPI000E6F63CE|nr:uncharacterized protein LOC113307688 [Papaver somniferum]
MTVMLFCSVGRTGFGGSISKPEALKSSASKTDMCMMLVGSICRLLDKKKFVKYFVPDGLMESGKSQKVPFRCVAENTYCQTRYPNTTFLQFHQEIRLQVLWQLMVNIYNSPPAITNPLSASF